MKRSPRPREASFNLSASVRQRLNTYAIAASAAGVSLLALAQPATAEIIYTPANGRVARDGGYNVDLNHDGIVDFTIAERANFTSLQSYNDLSALAARGNHVWCLGAVCTSVSTSNAEAPMSAGAKIGPARVGWASRGAVMEFEQTSRGAYFTAGPWAEIHSDAYLGLRFQIDGETHYGWARVRATFHRGSTHEERYWEAHVTGYAYETIANKAIEAGQTGENDGDAAVDAPSFPTQMPAALPQFGTLGALATGAEGLSRRKDSE
jgi:hypothetical protein